MITIRALHDLDVARKRLEECQTRETEIGNQVERIGKRKRRCAATKEAIAKGVHFIDLKVGVACDG